MSDTSISGTTLSLLREIVSAWANRNERRAGRDAGRLTFWRDGMLQQIEAIANGKHDSEAVRKLRKAFNESEEQVAEALDCLREVRSKIGPNTIGKQVDLVINHAEYGKTSIRFDVEQLLHTLESSTEPQHREMVEEGAKADAHYIANCIQAFNAEIGKLQRLVQAI